MKNNNTFLKMKHIIAVHGFGSNLEEFKENFNIEINKKFKIDFYKMPGHDKPNPFSIERCIKELAKENFDYGIGYSFGAYILLRAVIDYEKEVKKMILIAPLLNPRKIMIKKILKNPLLISFLFPYDSYLIYDFLFNHTKEHYYLGSFRLNRDLKSIEKFIKSFLHNKEIEKEGLEKIKKKVILIYGKKDKIVPRKEIKELEKIVKSYCLDDNHSFQNSKEKIEKIIFEELTSGLSS